MLRNCLDATPLQVVVEAVAIIRFLHHNDAVAAMGGSLGDRHLGHAG